MRYPTRRFERNEEAKARQQAEGNRKMEDVVMIYRKVSMPNGGESNGPRRRHRHHHSPTVVRHLPPRTLSSPAELAEHARLFRLGRWAIIMFVEEKKIKYYAIDSVDVLHKLGSAAGGDAW